MRRESIFKALSLLTGILVSFFAVNAFAVSSGIGAVAITAMHQLSGLAQLITAGSYVAGMGFAVAGVVKFKASKENAAQNPIGVPIAFVFIGAALIFIPSVYSSTGASLFTSGTVAGISGITSFAV